LDGLLGLDIGTTSTKAILFDSTGAEWARAVSDPYRNHTPHAGWVEQDANDLWGAVLSALREVLSLAGSDIKVRAVCMAAQSGSLLPADAHGEPVYPLITWMDGRTKDLVQRWRDEGVQDWVKPLSGWSLYPGLCLPTIAWLRENDPDTFNVAQHYFSVNDFLTYRFIGERITNPSNAGGMQFVDIHTAEWHSDLCGLAGITQQQLSKIEPAGSVMGRLKPEVARSVGLSEETVLINGGHDQVMTALGMGILNPGKLLLACGTAWVFTGISSTADRESIPDSLDLNFHAQPERWTISQSLGGLGASLEWWINQAFTGGRTARFAALDRELEGGGPNRQLMFVPMTGGHDDPSTIHSGGFLGLQLNHSRAEMARAVMESAGYELSWALDALRKARMPVESLWMAGGAGNSPHWPAILADITGLPIYLSAYDNWPALGAAVLAGTGIGMFDNVQNGLYRFQKQAERIDPDAGRSAMHQNRFLHYQDICQHARSWLGFE
jgi:xylulokinase